VTLFIVICAAMLAAALALVARPLLREIRGARLVLSVLGVLVPLVAITLYWRIGHRTWEQDEATAQVQSVAQHDLTAAISRLEQRVREMPDDADAALNLAEALVAQDEHALAGRAGELFEIAVARAPNNAKALWYGAINALAADKLPLARERLQRLLVQNPPENIRTIIERQIQDIEQQMGAVQVMTATGKIEVQVSLAPALAQGLDKSTPLFVLARDPVNAGPPLAVVRRSVGDLPLSVTLSDNDAMMRGRGISSVPRVQIVARISKSGAPQSQVGDLFGDALADVTNAKSIAVKIVIDRKVDRKVEK
jgi:cytochrome c-type biogenesis protein CcmH